MIYFEIMVKTDNKILKGYYKSVEHWDKQSFRDYLDYCKYFYKDDLKFRTNKYYQKVTKKDIEKIHNRFKEIERWMKTCNRLDEYDFDYSKISIGDYYYLNGESYDNYTIYFAGLAILAEQTALFTDGNKKIYKLKELWKNYNKEMPPIMKKIIDDGNTYFIIQKQSKFMQLEKNNGLLELSKMIPIL